MTSHSRTSRAHLLTLGIVLALIAGPSASAQVGEPTDLPFLSAETLRGGGAFEPGTPVAPTPKIVDGAIGDWVGEISRYGGTAVYSAGEYVYQDHIFDAYGPDDGRDTRRFERTDQVEDVAPGAYRVDALAQADAAGELGVPVPEEYATNDTYGDANDHADHADLEEVRVATDADSAYLLARTTTMTSPTSTGLLVLADTIPGETSREVPFGAGISTTVADVAVFLNGSSGTIVNLVDGTSTALPAGSVATDAGGFTNAIEARLPLSALSSPEGLKLAVASGTANSAGDGFAPLELEPYADSPAVHANLANVAFRMSEPVRIWFEKDQALALYAGSIDGFFTTVDVSKLAAGVTETFVPGTGYHDRIFISDSTPGVAREDGQKGLFQHYGVYLPSAYNGDDELPLQWWLHWRGGNAHSGAAVVPKMIKQLGEDRDTIVVSPSGRGSSQWYVGTGQVDFLEVWADVFDTFEVARNKVYVSGHSMGGFGTFLLTTLYPDRFAAGIPVSPPVTQGAWTGLDFEGCDDMVFDEYSPCYIQANQGNARAQHTRKLLENTRHVPLAIFAGAQDELVPVSGVLRQHERLLQLGYRHRMYTNVAAEHYTPPVMDQWYEVADYSRRFTNPMDPARVTYIRDMPFERATETSRSENIPLDFTFDSAYWMSRLTPSTEDGRAIFDGSSLNIPTTQDPWAEPYRAVPDTDAPTNAGEAGPYVVTGIQWLDDPASTAPEPFNGFNVDLKGASGVRIDLDRMSLSTDELLRGVVTTDSVLTLEMAGDWTELPEVTVTTGGPPDAVSLSDGILSITFQPGQYVLDIEPVVPATPSCLPDSASGAAPACDVRPPGIPPR